jgi:phosphatidylserine/phosphatidylglycerophosphate/cardiolipin synthase-like enzyme
LIGSIITSRSQQRNFQLIIITHDEEFVQLLGRSEHADYYWRVSKDVKYVSSLLHSLLSEFPASAFQQIMLCSGHSTLERQDIQDLSYG